MVRLVYVSKATSEPSEEELLKLLSNARLRNDEHGTTGLLLYGSGHFIQVLEGDEKSVDQLFDNISKDERHKDCKVLDYSQIETKSFPNWSMGFNYVNKDTALGGFSEFMQKTITPKELTKNPTSVISLLYSFKSRVCAL